MYCVLYGEWAKKWSGVCANLTGNCSRSAVYWYHLQGLQVKYDGIRIRKRNLTNLLFWEFIKKSLNCKQFATTINS